MNLLITGGSGTLGKALLNYYKDDHKVIIYSRDELKQHEIQKSIKDEKDNVRFFIGDIRDAKRLRNAMNGVDVVIHAAALKQVPACDYNPSEAVQTNVIGTMNVMQAAIDNKVKKVLLISTDKAVEPVNHYGATKFCAERLIINANQFHGWGETKFSCVRYGNVTGSRGSVLETYRNIADGIYPITDENMTRFWMTPKDAVEIIDYAINNMRGGEIFIPKMKAYRITTLALAVNPNAQFKVIGIRDGEKLHEKMLNENDKRHIFDLIKYFCINYGRYKYNNPVSPFEYESGTTERIGIDEMRGLLSGL